MLKHLQLSMVAAGFAGLLLTAAGANGQLFGRRPAPIQPAQTQPVPVQAAPDQASGQISPAPVAGQADAQQGRIIRGRNLVGMRIVGANRQDVGVVKDFIIDYQGDCPAIYFAVAPQLPSWTGGYVIVPFTAIQVGFDAQRRTDYFTLNMNVNDLGRAPRLAVNDWNSARVARAFANSKQFYQRVERTAARPQTGGRQQQPSLPSGASSGPMNARPKEPSSRNNGRKFPSNSPMLDKVMRLVGSRERLRPQSRTSSGPKPDARKGLRTVRLPPVNQFSARRVQNVNEKATRLKRESLWISG